MIVTENRPRISGWIGGGYLLLFAFIALLYITIVISTSILSHVYPVIIFTVVMTLAVVVLGIVAYSFHKTLYVIKDGFLHSWSPFAVINLRLSDITKIEKTRIPFYFKGWGASLYSGFFYIPALGWAKVIMTNLTDGLLITDKNKRHYLITPLNPDAFVKSLK